MQADAAFRRFWQNRPQPALISVHRGLWGPEPENSTTAIAAAAGLGIVEIDVQIAADGIPVVVHDPDLMRTAGVDLKVAKTTHIDLCAQNLRSGAGGADAELTDQHLPSLAEAIAAAGPGAYFDFDVKYAQEASRVAAWLHENNHTLTGSLKLDTDTKADIAPLLDLQNRFGIMVMAKVQLEKAGLQVVRDLVDAEVCAAEILFDDIDLFAQACAIAGDRMAVSTLTLDPVHCCGLSDTRAMSDPDRVWGRLIEAGATILMTDQAHALSAYMAKNS